ncbi:catalase-like [Folsomia candida]|nr:catalase-like [Folsomia candida]
MNICALVIHLFVAQCLGSQSNSPSVNHLTNWASTHPNDTTTFATTANGILYPSLSASQAIGINGHILLQDMFLLEKTQSFNRERIPERVVHAKGAGAFGFFQVNQNIAHITKAKFLQPDQKTRVAVRFSTVGGELGSSDTWVDPKGFAVKFYTTEGIHDLVGNNIQVFPIRDPMLFSDINRSRKRNAQTHLRDPTEWWDFVTLRPETTLHTLHLFSDMGTPRSFRGMDGAGVHTFKMVNSSESPVYVKFHWKTKQKKGYFTPQESANMAGINADVLLQDLYDAIELKEYPSWDLFIQVMTFDQAKKHPQNPFDITTFWRPEEYPLIPVGTMTLNENPKDYFSQVEQLAFSPSRMVPGIEPSPDRMLHSRIFSYPDAQMYRLGVNSHQIPVNKCPFAITGTYQRDGAMNVGSNGDGGPNYYPNSFHGVRQAIGVNTKFSVSGDVDRVDTGNEDNFSMAVKYLKLDVDTEERKRIYDNIADFLGKADKSVQDRFLTNNAYPVSQEFGDGMKDALERRRKMK